MSLARSRDVGRVRSGRGPQGPTPGSPADDVDPADPYDVARTICLQSLTAAPRSRSELARLLERRSVPSEVAEAVLDRLTEVGLVDDQAYARAWVESRHRGRGLSRAALAYELRRRGVTDDDVAPALETLDHDEELTTARRLVQRRLPATAGLDAAARTRRLAGMLARKGYPAGMVHQVVREALAAEADVVDWVDPASS